MVAVVGTAHVTGMIRRWQQVVEDAGRGKDGTTLAAVKKLVEL